MAATKLVAPKKSVEAKARKMGRTAKIIQKPPTRSCLNGHAAKLVHYGQIGKMCFFCFDCQEII